MKAASQPSSRGGGGGQKSVQRTLLLSWPLTGFHGLLVDMPGQPTPPVSTLSLNTYGEAADHLKVSTRTVRRLVDRGLLPRVRIGNAVRFATTDLEALVLLGREARPHDDKHPAGGPGAVETPAWRGRHEPA